MSQIISSRNRPALVTALVIVIAGLVLAACGSSSSGSSSSTNASASTTATGAAGAGGGNAGRFAATRECLQKNGITLPKRTSGQRRPPGAAGGLLGGGGAGAGGPKLPAGVTRAQYEAALKKCGGGNFARGGGGSARFNNPTFKAALAKFATCMKQNGVNVPAPNTSGNGPVFDTKGIDTSSAQFKAAEAKCQSDLSGAFRRGPNGGGSGGGGAPSGSGGAGTGAAPGGPGGEAPPAG